MKKFLFLLITFSLIFSFALVKAQNEEKENKKIEKVEKIEIKYEPQKGEKRTPVLSEKQPSQFKDFEDFIRKNIAEHPSASFFILNPSGYAAQQGIVEQNQNNVLTVNSQGFKMNWVVATETMVVASSRSSLLAQVKSQPISVSNITTGTRIRVFGNWDGNQLNAKQIVAFEMRIKLEVEDLIQKIKESLQKAGINIDLTPLFQQLQQGQ